MKPGELKCFNRNMFDFTDVYTKRVFKMNNSDANDMGTDKCES